MTAQAKFLFDVDFSAPAPDREAQALVPPAVHQAALADAETRGYRNGLAAAEAQARTEAERRSAAAFERIAAGLESLRTSQKIVEDHFEAEAVDVAVAVAKKLASTLLAREPFAEIAALADGCFRDLLAAPHIVIRVNEELYAAAKERLEELARSRGFEGRLIVMGEADVAPGDCRIEWADGGLVRDRAATEQAIADAVARYVAVRRGSAATA
jgi:flagellar assembly protein FliH